MEKRQERNGATTHSKKKAEQAEAAGGRSAEGDDCSQLDGIIGGFGRYQLMIFLFKIFIGATSAFNNLGVTFFAPSDFISFWCADSAALGGPAATAPTTLAPDYVTLTNSTLSYALSSGGLGNDTYLIASSHHVQPPPPARSFMSQNMRQLLGDFVFSRERSLKKQHLSYSSDTPRNLRKECDYVSPIDQRRHKCTAYKYDTGIWISTIIDEWDLVCDRALFISITQSLYMGGFIVSFLVFGYISDRFGRWNSLVLGALIEILSGLGCVFANSIGSFMVFRFLLGLGNAGRSSSSYLIMIEWTGQAWRMHISTLGSLGWAFGYCFMPWIVLFFLHFRHMQLFVCFYEFIFLLWLLRLPESPRWLLTHHRFTEAYEVLLNAARFNKLIIENNKPAPAELAPAPVPPATNGNRLGQAEAPSLAQDKFEFKLAKDLDGSAGSKVLPETTSSNGSDFDNDQKSLRPYTLEEFDFKFGRLCETISRKQFAKNEDRLSILDLFRWPNLRKYTLILAFAWACNSFIYYGIVLRVGDLGGKNLFVSFTFAGATELPSIAFTIICMKFLPRKTTNIFLFSMICLLCALQVPLKLYDLPWLQQIAMMLAKLFNTCSFTCILYQTMELFPTSIRQTAYSSCSLAGRIGSILAPFIKELSQVTNNLVPPVIYALLTIFEIFAIRHLPETQGTDLPDTLLEAESFKGTDKLPAKSGKSSPRSGPPGAPDELSLRRRKLTA